MKIYPFTLPIQDPAGEEMEEGICEVCGYRSQLGGVEKRPVFPKEIIEEAHLNHWQIIEICSNCQIELARWYSLKVAPMAYNVREQRFSYKTPGEIVDEYQAAYNSFIAYKKKRAIHP